jgi:hypothetical protein
LVERLIDMSCSCQSWSRGVASFSNAVETRPSETEVIHIHTTAIFPTRPLYIPTPPAVGIARGILARVRRLQLTRWAHV